MAAVREPGSGIRAVDQVHRPYGREGALVADAALAESQSGQRGRGEGDSRHFRSGWRDGETDPVHRPKADERVFHFGYGSPAVAIAFRAPDSPDAPISGAGRPEGP